MIESKQHQLTPSEAALLAFLQSELLIISNECRRKQPEVKQSLDGILQDLRPFKDHPTHQCTLQEYLRQKPSILQACLQVARGPCASRCLHSAVSVTFRLVNQAACPGTALTPILDVLERGVRAGDRDGGGEDVQLRCLQAAIPVWQHFLEGLVAGDGEALMRLLSVTFRLCCNNACSTGNAAMAITRQLLIYLFEYCQEHRDKGEQVLCKVLLDICHWIHNEPASSIQIVDSKATPSSAFCIELLESLLAKQRSSVHTFQAVILLLREQVCPFIVRRLNDLSDFPLAVRLWRFIGVLLAEYHADLPLECEIFLSFMSRVLEDRESEELLQRLFVLETIESLLQDQETYSRLCKLSGSLASEQSPAFPDLLRSLFRFTLNEITDLGMNKPALSLEGSSLRVSLLASFERQPAPNALPSTYALLLSFKSLAVLAPHGPCIEANGKTMAEIIDRVCGLKLDTSWIDLAMQVFRKWVEACRSCKPALETAMEALCSIACTVSASPSEYSEVVAAAVRTVFALCIDMGDVFEQDMFQHMGRVVYAVDASGSPELLQLANELLAKSTALSLPSYTLFQSALTDLVRDKKDQRSALKLQQLASINAARFVAPSSATSWGLLSEAVCFLTRIEHDYSLRQIGCDIVRQSTAAFFTNVSLPGGGGQIDDGIGGGGGGGEGGGDGTSDGDEIGVEEGRVVGLQLLFDVVGEHCRAADVLRSALDTLHSTLTIHGQSFRWDSGWHRVLAILGRVMDRLPEASGVELPQLMLLRALFATVTLIGSEFVGVLSKDCLQEYTVLLGRVYREDHDLNISLSAIGQLWDAADAVVTKGWKGEWKMILRELAEGSADRRCEVRNSCVQTVFRTVEVHGREVGDADWPDVFAQVIRYLCEQTDRAYLALPITDAVIDQTHHSRDTARKQWDESLVFILQGLTQVFREHGAALQPDIWSFYAGRLHRAICDSGRAELVAVGITCIQVLASCALADSKAGWAEWKLLWGILLECSRHSLGKFADCFEQSTLLVLCNVVKLVVTRFATLVSDDAGVDVDAAAEGIQVKDVFGCIQQVLLHPPASSDRVHDADNMNEVQRFVVNQLLSAESIDAFYTTVPGCKAAVVQMIAHVLDFAQPNEQVELIGCLSAWSQMLGKQNLPELPAGSQRKDYTRVALYVALFAFIESHLDWFSAGGDALWTAPLPALIKALAKWAGELKYRAPSHKAADLMPPWIVATTTLLHVLTVCNSSPLKHVDDFWVLSAQCLARILVESAEKVPVDIEADRLDAHEQIDLHTLDFIDSIVTMQGGEEWAVPEEAIKVLLRAVTTASQLYNVITDHRNALMAPVLAIDDTERVVKGRLAAQALLLLFKRPVAKAFLVERIEAALEGYMAVQQKLGCIPAPLYTPFPCVIVTCVCRSRQEELDFILSQMHERPDIIKSEYRYLVQLLVAPITPKGITKKAADLLLSLHPLDPV